MITGHCGCGRVTKDKFHYLSGEADISMYKSSANHERPEGYHIYVDSKAPWHEISNSLKQYHEDVPN